VLSYSVIELSGLKYRGGVSLFLTQSKMKIRG